MHNPTSVEENDTQTPLGFWHTNGSPNLGQTTKPYNNQQKKENLQNYGICYTSWPQSKTERKHKYLDLVRELKKPSDMKVMIRSIVISTLGTVTEGLVQGLEDLEIIGRVEIIQTTVLMRSARVLRKALETWWELLSLKLQWKTIN